MTYLMSRANYERCTEGMTDAQRRDFDRDFTPYPDRVSPDARIDLDRVADTYAQLVARETGTPPLTFEQVRERSPFAGWDVTTTTAPYTAAWVNCAKGNGKSSWRPPDPWREISDGVYVAPPGTPGPEPFFTPDGGPAPPIAGQATAAPCPYGLPCGWMADMVRTPVTPGGRQYFVDRASSPGDSRYTTVLPPTCYPTDHDLLGGWLNDDEGSTRRYFLNQRVAEHESQPRDIIAGMPEWWRKHRSDPLAGPQRLAAGELALTAFQLAAQPVKMRTFDEVTVDLTGIPIVPGRDLAADVWQLIDADTGEVLHEGTIGPALAGFVQEMLDQASDAAGELADRSGVPRDQMF